MARREADFPEMPDADRPAKARKLSRVVKRPDGQQYDKPLDEKYLMAQRYGWAHGWAHAGAESARGSARGRRRPAVAAEAGDGARGARGFDRCVAAARHSPRETSTRSLAEWKAASCRQRRA